MPTLFSRNIYVAFYLLFFVMLSPVCNAEEQRGETETRLERSYKAKTVEECIHEKECVWFAFESLVKNTYPARQNKNVFRRWNDYIHIKVVGDSTGLFQNEVEGTVKKIAPLLPVLISVKDPYNVLVFFSDNFENDIKKYSPVFKKILHKDWISESYYRDFRPNAKCFGYNFTGADNAFNRSVIFVTKDSAFRKSCIEGHVFRLLGFGKELKDFPFSISNSAIQHPQQMTDLDFFLISILYHQDFMIGVEYQDIQTIFDEVYPKALATFLSRKNSEKNHE